MDFNTIMVEWKVLYEEVRCIGHLQETLLRQTLNSD